jgi:23S rRNA pseudouridine2605 synthase
LARAPRNSAGPGRDHRNVHGTRRPSAARPRGDNRRPEPRAEAKVKPAPPPRKHVSVLRAEYGEPSKERQRIERRETADRGGRTVYVERLVSAKRDDKRQDKRKPPSSKPTNEGTTDGAFQKTRQERWQKPPRAKKNSAFGTPNVNGDREERLARPYRKFEAEDRRTGGSPEGCARGRDHAQKRSNGPRSRPHEKPGVGRPAGRAKPPSVSGPRGRGEHPKRRPRGKS